MKRIAYPPKFYLFDLVLSVIGMSLSIVALITLIPIEHIWGMIFYIALLLIALCSLVEAISHIQWVQFDKGVVCVRNVFGVISKLELSKIQTIKTMPARAFSIKMYSKHFSCIVLSSRKSIRLCDVHDAYNHKKASYIIFPNTVHNKQLLQKVYFEITGNDISILRNHRK